jgi:hypothetical protein
MFRGIYVLFGKGERKIVRVGQSYRFTLAASVAVGCGLTVSAGAQSVIFPYSDAGGSHRYGLLNGDYLALYVNDRGDLGAPYRNIGATKPTSGALNGIYAVVNANGSVPDGPTPATRYTYAALFSKTPTVGLPPVALQTPLQTSIQAKTEYATVGNNPLEAYGVYVPGNNPASSVWLHNGDFSMDNTASAFSVSGKQGGVLSATSLVNNASTGINVAQTITIDDKLGDNKQNVAQFHITVTNNSSKTLNGVQYARVINPNMGAYSGGPNSTVQSLGTASDTSAFAIDASAAGRQLALGLDPANSSDSGTTIFSTNIVKEDLLFSSLNATIAGSNRVVLGNGTNASYYLGGQVNAAATGSYTDYSMHGFVSQVNFNSDPVDDSLVLVSPSYDLASGQSFSFSFSYYFDQLPLAGDPVPEPGVLGLVAGGLVFGGIGVHRRKRFTNRPI